MQQVGVAQDLALAGGMRVVQVWGLAWQVSMCIHMRAALLLHSRKVCVHVNLRNCVFVSVTCRHMTLRGAWLVLFHADAQRAAGTVP